MSEMKSCISSILKVCLIIEKNHGQLLIENAPQSFPFGQEVIFEGLAITLRIITVW